MSKEINVPVWNCYRRVKNFWIGSGADSDVYRDGDFVVKAYKNGPFAENPDEAEFRLNLYKKITNKAAEILDLAPFAVNFPFSKESYRLKINPYIEVARCLECDLVEGISQFVPGKRLPELMQEFDSKELTIVFKGVSQKLGEMLGVAGINVIPFNVKQDEGGLLIVTDLCSDIADLRPTALHI